MRLRMDLKLSLSTIFIVFLMCSLIKADKATMERIRKHQEWLKQRNQGRNGLLATAKPKKSIELVNLWRFDKKDNNNNNNNNNINEVYPENDNILTTPALSTTTTSTTTTTATSPPTTIKTTLLSTTMTTTSTRAPLTTPSPTPSPTRTTTTTLPTIITTSLKSFIQSFNNTLPQFNSNFHLKSFPTTTSTTATIRPTSNNWLSNDILETTTLPFTSTTTPSVTTTTARKPKSRPYPRWANWGAWSECSRSCGGGIKHQLRKCVNRNSLTGKLHLSKNCLGVYKRYQLCNEQACPSHQNDFRAQQCSSYNNVDFQGQQFMWEPYIKDDAECELNCKPLGMKYFATLNATVIDGTPCDKPAEYYRSNYRGRAICIDGICKAIQASGIITGLSANSGAVSCGGLLCRPITGLFTRDPLPDDAYIHVATIPAGASNISITELKNSMNLLVLSTDEDSYIINGDNSVSESGAYEAGGAIFDYHRLDGLQAHAEGVTEWVTCTGPIRDNVELMIYSKALNPGIKYEYLLPITSDSEENEVSLESDGFLKSGIEETSIGSSQPTRRRRYNWKVVGFSTCSKSCGGGTQTPVIRCVRENPLRYYSQRRCAHAEKPVINENLLRCNTQPCPAYWRLDDWNECRCQHGEGFKERELSCVQELASGIVIHVDNSACMEEKPMVKKPCDCPKNRRRSNQRYRLHGLSPNTSHANIRKNERAGTWLMSDWNQYCSADCGSGVEYRTIYCDRSKPNTERCDIRSTPEITRTCEGTNACETGEWFSGPWTPCNGNCFNLTRTRQVLCIHNQLIVEDEDCRPELRPSNMEKCSHEEVEYCGPRWHYSEWSECTKTCNTGTQRRTVKCLEYNDHENALKESNKCRYSIREPIYRSCNTHKCEESARYERLQNDGAMPSCSDEIANCQWAIKAKLCSYEYYQHKCCYSCSIAG